MGSSIDFKSAATRVVQILQDNGHVAYFAGGCVRDMLLGNTPKDYDVATDATPDDVKAMFRHARLVGEAFGVVLVRMKRHEIEVATFRREWGYADGRHPDNVQFTNAEQDAQRRDFTINGLFYDPIGDRIHDFVDGRRDLERGVVRAIGMPDERFAEDYLRMLRAVRFTARMGFELDHATSAAIKKHANRLGEISRERIGQELESMFRHANRADAATLLQTHALDAETLREPTSDRNVELLATLPVESDHATCLSAWILDRTLEGEFRDRLDLIDAIEGLSSVKIVRRWRGALTLSNENTDGVRNLLSQLGNALRWPSLETAPKKRLLARQDWSGLDALIRACDQRHDGERLALADIDSEVASLRDDGVAPIPFVTGDDLIRNGLKPGPAFKRILDQVYDAQLEHRVDDVDTALAFAMDIAGA